ncbi:adenine phosphoribosyltransferase [Mesomycoplasma moatsii]|uniref:adenine phosphoribosyltransferase n=1 Tax=Mesomycoplasma moatsii TaxID=171287 RepID=UPI0003B430F8
MDLKKFIDDVKDFPEKGINFKDISPLLANGEALNYTVNKMAEFAKDADVIVGPDARGFLFGTPVASILKKPFVMVRKAKKLPGDVIRKEYHYEYSSNVLEMQKNRIFPGQKVVVIDDILATGGTTKAIIDLIESQGAIVQRVIFLLELKDLKGLDKYHGIEVISLVKM